MKLLIFECEIWGRDDSRDTLTLELPFVPRINEQVESTNGPCRVIMVHYTNRLPIIRLTLEKLW